ncbi:hypothetical protein BU24DRAFT_415475 [Aaosphaeria arxii CBS 175.79]|uniref:Zn(2)-C6 fungal-type domain-containing protein n=1 Tax=Aaosphaeria arxii CBS 175.79 TaxID=1450172 RepID=A0A6A5X6T5_9PLEO|nr:uncharacterized protein BU24DRAFT_415475 [Aaosphaeria arxii CBS 175.79]KAF2008725.1 hypothetical protein BU24DRAFT_415475 [Aaosphaeria arxii CBS 175.79]
MTDSRLSTSVQSLQSGIIVWPAKEPDQNTSRPQRARLVLSCEQCHKSKIRCNRRRPCNRCTKAGREEHCTYQSAPKNLGQSSPATDSSPKIFDPSLFALYLDGKARSSTITRWAKLVSEFREGREYFFGIHPDFRDTFQKVQDLAQLYPTPREGSFPFGDGSVGEDTMSRYLSHIPDKRQCNLLLDNYLRTIETIFPLWHHGMLENQFRAFCDDPNKVDASWFSQFCMMLSVSCWTAPAWMQSQFDVNLRELSWALLEIAEKALKQWELFDLPDIATIRSLCLMAIAKMFEIVPMSSLSSLATIMGMVVRTAMMHSMHRDPKWFTHMPKEEVVTRRKMWTTIVFLDLYTAIDVGLPTLVRATDYDTGAIPSYSEEADTECTSNSSDSPTASQTDPAFPHFQSLLSRTFASASFIINTVNSVRPTIPFSAVLHHDKILRVLLAEASNLPLEPLGSMNSEGYILATPSDPLFQKILLEIYIRRLLLTLHQPYARAEGDWATYEKSHWAVLECSLALLNYHQKLVDIMQPSNASWLGDLFGISFNIASIYVALGLRRNEFTFGAEQGAAGGVVEEVAAKEIAWGALRKSTDLFREQLPHSLNAFKFYMGSVFLIAGLEALEDGGEAVFLERMNEAAMRIVEETHAASLYLVERCYNTFDHETT